MYMCGQAEEICKQGLKKQKEIFRSGRSGKVIDIVRARTVWIRLMKKRTLTMQSAIILLALIMGYIHPSTQYPP